MVTPTGVAYFHKNKHLAKSEGKIYPLKSLGYFLRIPHLLYVRQGASKLRRLCCPV